MKSTFLGLIAASVLALSAQVSATPMISGDINTGSSFRTDAAFSFVNNSTDGEKIESITWDISSSNAFFDSLRGGFGMFYSSIISSSLDDVGYTFPSNGDLDGQSVLTISFDDFDAGESFSFGVDTDFFHSIDDNPVRGVDYIGTLLTVQFSNGSTGWGEFGSTSRTGKGSEVTAIPEPGSLAILGLGLVGFAFSRRQKRK